MFTPGAPGCDSASPPLHTVQLIHRDIDHSDMVRRTDERWQRKRANFHLTTRPRVTEKRRPMPRNVLHTQWWLLEYVTGAVLAASTSAVNIV